MSVTFLRQGKLLRTSNYANFFINEDLTITQEKQKQLLTGELKRKRLNNEDVIVRRNKVVLRIEAYRQNSVLAILLRTTTSDAR